MCVCVGFFLNLSFFFSGKRLSTSLYKTNLFVLILIYDVVFITCKIYF